MNEDLTIAPEEKPLVPISKPSLVYSVTILWLLYIFDLAARMGVNVIFPQMQADLGLSDAQIGLIGSASMIGMVLLVLPFSYFADKYSKKKAVLAMSSTWCLGTFLCGGLSSFGSLILGRFMVGAGNSGYCPVSISMLTSWFKRSMWSRVISVYNTANGLGTALGTWAAGAVVVYFGTWRAAFFVLAIPTLVLVILAFFMKDANVRTTDIKNKVQISTILNATVKNFPLMMVCCAVGVGFLVIAGNMIWIPMYLSRDMGWTTTEIATKMAIVFLVTGLTANIIAGFILDWGCKINARFRVIFPAFLYIIVGLSFMWFFAYQDFRGIWVANFCFMMAPVATNTATQELVSAQFKSSALGFYVVFLQCVGACGPVLMGGLSGTFGLMNTMIYAQGFLFLGALCFIIASFSYTQQLNRALIETQKCENDS